MCGWGGGGGGGGGGVGVGGGVGGGGVGGGGGCYWASRTAVSIEKGVSVSSKIRERGVFFKLGYKHGIRFGRERDAGDGVSEGEFTKALLLTQTTNHMPGKVWD